MARHTRVITHRASARAVKACLSRATVALAAISVDRVAIVANLALNTQPVATAGTASVHCGDAATGACKARLNCAVSAAAVASNCVIVVALLLRSPEHTYAVTALRHTRVQAADARAFGHRRSAHKARLHPAERIAAIATLRVVVVAEFGRAADAVAADVDWWHVRD